MQTRHECGVQGPQTRGARPRPPPDVSCRERGCCGDARSTLSTHGGSSTLHGKPTPSQNSRPGASCTVVATRVEWSATPAITLGQREREAQATQEQSVEERWFNFFKPTLTSKLALLPLRMDGSDRALALANWHKNDRVSSPQPRQLKPLIWPERVVQSARDKCALSCVWLLGELHRPCEQHHASLSHRSATWTPKSCQWPVVCHQTVANRLRQLPAVWCRGRAEQAKSMSLTIMLRVTRPPASRQTLAAALSTANPRRPNTPALEHAARWWPKESKGRPHLHKRNESGKGRRRQRRRTRNKVESMRVRKLAGN